jgi:arabinogalactan endo-1,4-beta-galactosidase
MKKRILSGLLVIISFVSCTKNNEGQVAEPPSPYKYYKWDAFSMGCDLSYVNELEDYGAVFRDSGQVTDPFQALKNHGMNTVRVRLWHNPTWVSDITGGKMYSDLYDAEKTIRRAHALGLAVNLDFHYSDEWADPGNQKTPAAWSGLDLETLRDSVYNYTLYVLNYLKSKSLTPEMVQIGNETNPGMLFPAGKVEGGDYQAFGLLLNAGIKAVRDFSAGSTVKPKIILHVAQLQNATWWMDDITKKAKVTDFDILGVSHYPKWSTVNAMQQITALLRVLTDTYQKEVMIVETAYPWTGEDADSYTNIISGADSVTGYLVTPEGQRRYLIDLTKAIMDGGGKGIMYWEPAWITSSMKDKWGTGSSWDNCTLFDFNGNLLPGAAYLRNKY